MWLGVQLGSIRSIRGSSQMTLGNGIVFDSLTVKSAQLVA